MKGNQTIKLRKYQLEDVNYLAPYKTHGIFNEQRTGKTPTSLVSMATKALGRILIVATASMIYKWQDEAHTWTNRQAFVYAGTAKQRTTALNKFKETTNAILIISYGLLKNTRAYNGLVDDLRKVPIEGLIVDEVHRAVGRKTANFKALRKLVKIPYRYYLTGTPSPNHPSQVWSILTLIDPDEFPSYWRYVEEYFVVETVQLPYHLRIRAEHVRKPTDFLKGMEEKHVQILNKYSIMRKRKDVMQWLPKEEEPTKIRLPLTPLQKKYIESMTKYYEAGDNSEVMTQGILDQILRLRQICNAPKLLGLRGGSPKIDWLKDYIKDYPEKSIIIFSKFTQYIDLIKKEIPHVGVLVGSTTPAERLALINDFQSDKLKVLISQIDAGKEGITLDNADTLIFTDVFPPASDILQAKDRIVATTEEAVKPKEIIQLMMADSYDEELYKLVEEKIELTDIVNNYIDYIKGE